MDQSVIFRPFFALIFLTIAVWCYMYARRIPFIVANKLSAEQLRPLELARISPPAVANPADNLKNLFEVPTLFYALSLYLYVVGQVDAVYVSAAWAFVGLRVAHSAVHCTINIVVLRFWIYALATLALWFMVVRAALVVFG
jgi:hypothetical protein